MLTQALKHLVLLIGGFVVLAPFAVMLSYSLKSPSEIETGTGGFFGAQAPMLDTMCMARSQPDRAAMDVARAASPGQSDDAIMARLEQDREAACTTRPAVFNYTKAFTEAPLLRYLLNGLIVTVSIFVIQVIVALPAAYALTKLRFWGRDAAFALVLFCLLIPVNAVALPLYLGLAKLGLTNSYAALVIPWTISAFGIFLMRQFFQSVPDDLVDAARMDGMGEFAIVWRVMLPTAIPALIAFAIFSITAHWNDYFWPRIVITGDRDLFTPPLGLREFQAGADGSLYGPMMATATIIVIPLIAAFLLAQRRFIEGIALSGMK